MLTTSQRHDTPPGNWAGSCPDVPMTAREAAATGPCRAALRAPPLALALATMLVGLGLSVPPAAHAGLGEPVESVQRDHAALRGKALAVTPAATFDRHEITTAEGTLVSEYASHAGTVFAVTWSGRSLPDLKVVLGQHYGAYAAATTGRRGNHHVFTIETADLVLHIRKLPRGFTGSAHVPALLPPGTAAADIR